MHCWASYLLVATVVTLGTISMIGACGQKGPLYLPKGPPAGDEQPKPRPQPAADAADDPAASAPAPTSEPARP